MEQQLHPADKIMIMELEAEWDNTKDLPLQERFEKLIQEAKKHYMVFYRDKQMNNVIYALGSIYKKESEEKFNALALYIKMRVRTQEWVNELCVLSEAEVAEYMDEKLAILLKYHDIKDPEKRLLPENWNELWLK